MNKDTRNRIQRATQAARVLLEHEYTEQLQGIFDIRRDGTIESSPGKHLDAHQRVVRSKLVSAVEHENAVSRSHADAVAAYLREAAFTTLNRFVALKMLEARSLVQECVSKGAESSGFKNEFGGLAPGLRQLDDSYRIFIESLFDEIGREVRVLFDRRDPASILWPRRQALLELLNVLNDPELAGIWGEDETIGWVYQYFNSDDERKQMRAESQAPRNSRELAVRNQFFTPRYVVQFLTDNTLGRIWYEMRQGDTRLRELKYLVRRKDEVFLGEGTAPVVVTHDRLTQRELLQRPVQVPFRTKKDPRDIRVLDPACGSGHFLLYAFDLFLTIYEEAWADKSSPSHEGTGRTLREDYSDSAALREAVPALILRYNLHGIDIDSRCAQIAALALWMRAQRANRDLGIRRDGRIRIARTNVVVAEPMPGEAALRGEFLAGLEPKLARLVERIFQIMQLAGVAGALLRVEADIRDAVRSAYGEHGALFEATDEATWQRVEQEMLSALRSYAEATAGGQGFQRRLFADDAARGLGLISLTRLHYDVALMNPPFGDPPGPAKDYIFDRYGPAKTEMYASFVDRLLELAPNGLVGCLSSRSGYFLKTLEAWRRQSLLHDESCVRVFADLGSAVLDAAVECACVVIGRRAELIHCFTSNSELHGADLIKSVQSLVDAEPDGYRIVTRDGLSALPGATFAFGLPEDLLSLFTSRKALGDVGFVAKQGIGTSDNFRFLRLWWEVPHTGERRWWRYAKGGSFSPFYYDGSLTVNWGSDGAEVKAYSAKLYGTWSKQITNTQYFGAKGLTYASRTHREFAPAFLPPGSAFDTKGCCVFSGDERSDTEWLSLLGYMNSRLFAGLLRVGLARASSGLARQYNESLVMAMPAPRGLASHTVAERSSALVELHRRLEVAQETSTAFEPRVYLDLIRRNVASEELSATRATIRADWERQATLASQLDEIVLAIEVGEASPELLVYLDEQVGRLPGTPDGSVSHWDVFRATAICQAETDANKEEASIAFLCTSLAFGYALGRRWQDRNSDSEKPTPWSAFDDNRFVPVATAPTRIAAVDDPGAPDDCVDALVGGFSALGASDAERAAAHCALACTGSGDVRTFLCRHFFDLHLRAYSSDKRKAPLYWQLGTPSGRYSVWLYYFVLTSDTIYQVLNQHVSRRFEYEERTLRNMMEEAGASPTASQRNQIDEKRVMTEELRTFQAELVRIAPLWKPNLNDGVIINFAPLWRLVPHHRTWQKACKSTWDKLCKGDYDWAHLAMHLWPERVVPKCAEDLSLAIAHGLENVFWYEDSEGKWQARKVEHGEIDKLISERASAAVKDALKSLLEAPAPATGRTTRKKAPRAKGTRKRTASARPKAAKNGASSSGRSSTAVDAELLKKVKAAIASNGDGASKADVIDATGISASEWNKSIKALLADGSVKQTGERRGARYHLGGGDA